MIGNIEIQDWAKSMKLGQKMWGRVIYSTQQKFQGIEGMQIKAKWSVFSSLIESKKSPLFLTLLNSTNLFKNFFLIQLKTNWNNLIHLFVNTFFLSFSLLAGRQTQWGLRASLVYNSIPCLDHCLALHLCSIKMCWIFKKFQIFLWFWRHTLYGPFNKVYLWIFLCFI